MKIGEVTGIALETERPLPNVRSGNLASGLARRDGRADTLPGSRERGVARSLQARRQTKECGTSFQERTALNAVVCFSTDTQFLLRQCRGLSIGRWLPASVNNDLA